MIHAVLSHLDFVAKFTVTNQSKDFINTEGGRESHVFVIFSYKKNV